jgi:hypothetical protein
LPPLWHFRLTEYLSLFRLLSENFISWTASKHGSGCPLTQLSGEGSLSGFYRWSLLAVSSPNGRILVSSALKRSLSPFMWVLPSWPNHLLRVLPPDTITWELGFKMWLWGHANM